MRITNYQHTLSYKRMKPSSCDAEMTEGMHNLMRPTDRAGAEHNCGKKLLSASLSDQIQKIEQWNVLRPMIRKPETDNTTSKVYTDTGLCAMTAMQRTRSKLDRTERMPAEMNSEMNCEMNKPQLNVRTNCYDALTTIKYAKAIRDCDDQIVCKWTDTDSEVLVWNEPHTETGLRVESTNSEVLVWNEPQIGIATRCTENDFRSKRYETGRTMCDMSNKRKMFTDHDVVSHTSQRSTDTTGRDVYMTSAEQTVCTEANAKTIDMMQTEITNYDVNAESELCMKITKQDVHMNEYNAEPRLVIADSKAKTIRAHSMTLRLSCNKNEALMCSMTANRDEYSVANACNPIVADDNSTDKSGNGNDCMPSDRLMSVANRVNTSNSGVYRRKVGDVARVKLVSESSEHQEHPCVIEVATQESNKHCELLCANNTLKSVKYPVCDVPSMLRQLCAESTVIRTSSVGSAVSNAYYTDEYIQYVTNDNEVERESVATRSENESHLEYPRVIEVSEIQEWLSNNKQRCSVSGSVSMNVARYIKHPNACNDVMCSGVQRIISGSAAQLMLTFGYKTRDIVPIAENSCSEYQINDAVRPRVCPMNVKITNRSSSKDEQSEPEVKSMVLNDEVCTARVYALPSEIIIHQENCDVEVVMCQESAQYGEQQNCVSVRPRGAQVRRDPNATVSNKDVVLESVTWYECNAQIGQTVSSAEAAAAQRDRARRDETPPNTSATRRTQREDEHPYTELFKRVYPGCYVYNAEGICDDSVSKSDRIVGVTKAAVGTSTDYVQSRTILQNVHECEQMMAGSTQVTEYMDVLDRRVDDIILKERPPHDPDKTNAKAESDVNI